MPIGNGDGNMRQIVGLLGVRLGDRGQHGDRVDVPVDGAPLEADHVRRGDAVGGGDGVGESTVAPESEKIRNVAAGEKLQIPVARKEEEGCGWWR